MISLAPVSAMLTVSPTSSLGSYSGGGESRNTVLAGAGEWNRGIDNIDILTVFSQQVLIVVED